MSIELATIFLFTLLIVLLALGVPVAFALGGSAVIICLVLWGVPGLTLVVQSALNNMKTIILAAVPLFIFMGAILQYSGLAESLYAMMHAWIGGLRGGMAVGTVIICTMFAACTGISGAATVTMGLVALPSMLQLKYDKKLAMGCIMGGGALGPLIPPSIIMILYAFMAAESVGRLFAGGILPGLLLASLFIIYILVLCHIRPNLGPALPPQERAGWKKMFLSLRAVILPILLIITVLGAIFSGFATPTEAAGLGAFGAIICALIYRRLTWTNLKQAVYQTVKLSSMVMWIVVGATAFTLIYTGIGGPDLIQGLVMGWEIPPMAIVIIMQITFFILGCFMDPTGIALLCTPIYVPLIKALGFDSVWFGVLFVVNMEMAYLTPPFGFNLFYMKGVVPQGITMVDIYKSAIPFIVVQAITLVLVIIFPEIILVIPNLIFG